MQIKSLIYQYSSKPLNPLSVEKPQKIVKPKPLYMASKISQKVKEALESGNVPPPFTDPLQLKFIKEISKTGELYEGYSLNGKRYGYGTLTIPNKLTYCGHFKNGQFDGSGTLKFVSGKIYEGKFKDGKPLDGEGTLKFGSGVIYKGSFEKMQMHGEGEVSFPDKTKFKATFKQGRVDQPIEFADLLGKKVMGKEALDRFRNQLDNYSLKL